MRQRLVLLLAAPALAVAVAVAASSVVLLATGNSPGRVFWVMAVKGTKTDVIISMLNRTGPYYIAGVAVAVG
ncbi:MAG: hypothetical protein JWM05_3074, partial [Acidimicrobiales bacterium]|nr:hypothetical protein [Acidimicrobiales bacterium]